MVLSLNRRTAVMLPILLAACGDDERPVPKRGGFPPLRYGYLPPINLNVKRVEMAEGFTSPPVGNGEVIGLSPVDPVETLFAMARDRLKPVSNGGTAKFGILTASITRRRDMLNGTLAVRLDVRDGDDTNSGYAEARVTADRNGPVSDQREIIYEMLKSMMEQMNVELEFQIRKNLRSWIVEPPAGVPRVDPSATPPITPAPSRS